MPAAQVNIDRNLLGVKVVADLEALGERCRALRAQGKRIVHCHGVFDLLHIGHIQYFKAAKSLGDVLVVTLTSDRFVNKGPHRPVFPAAIRAQAVAALADVDWVAINDAPLSVGAIKAIEPHYYVKGPDYLRAQDDKTGGIVLEEAAVRSVGGHLVATNTDKLSSTELINQYFPVQSTETQVFLRSFASRYSTGQLGLWLDQMRTLKVLVVGEAIIDEYQYCATIGKASKEPTLVVKLLESEKFVGGSLAIANHAADFAGRVGLMSVVGDDGTQAFVSAGLDRRVKSNLVTQANAPTILKRRYVDKYFFSKLFETYAIQDDALSSRERRQLRNKLEREIPKYDVVIVADYGHGMIDDAIVDVLTKHAKFLAVNTQSNAGNLGYHTISKYPRADYVCIAEGELRLEERNRTAAAADLLKRVAQRLKCRAAVVTRGKNGSLCLSRKTGLVDVPAFAGKVIDRVGAGDTYLAVSAMAVALGIPMEAVGVIGNAAGALAVATVGNREPITKLSLNRYLESLLKI